MDASRTGCAVGLPSLPLSRGDASAVQTQHLPHAAAQIYALFDRIHPFLRPHTTPSSRTTTSTHCQRHITYL
ncbi:hypothetical protein CALCODRAFT_490984 [Calocera cornea HHB12733]|uniref:Uncharacterized protein n=1 Tax=Calocera cornea HHB12733 TaxID=1353952 RepID=A0A165JE87_9BASI|nr:hypothetical protein CALCODRAFT_490984 [Calocera cornea HHB12733]